MLAAPAGSLLGLDWAEELLPEPDRWEADHSEPGSVPGEVRELEVGSWERDAVRVLGA